MLHQETQEALRHGRKNSVTKPLSLKSWIKNQCLPPALVKESKHCLRDLNLTDLTAPNSGEEASLITVRHRIACASPLRYTPLSEFINEVKGFDTVQGMQEILNTPGPVESRPQNSSILR